MANGLLTVFLCGDVMLGRGVDQILPCPGDPRLREMRVWDAGIYVKLAEAAHGHIPSPVDFSWPWGDALAVLDEYAPDVRVANLETSVTRQDQFAPRKDVHYRMNPANLPCLASARPDVCVLANNHVLDFGRAGLAETLEVLAGAGLRAAGAGADLTAAWRPATIDVGDGRKVIVFSLGMASSGIPEGWAATDERSGVAFVRTATDRAADEITDRIRSLERRRGDVVIVSVHWGSNWGYRVSPDQTRFAHRLIDGGVDVVHGHSSHHPRPIEVYRGKLILYGCGDLINDYEGIGGYEQFRDDLRLCYFASFQPDTAALAELRIVPLQAHRLRLRYASNQDAAWLRATLERVSREFGSRVLLEPDGVLAARW